MLLINSALRWQKEGTISDRWQAISEQWLPIFPVMQDFSYKTVDESELDQLSGTSFWPELELG